MVPGLRATEHSLVTDQRTLRITRVWEDKLCVWRPKLDTLLAVTAPLRPEGCVPALLIQVHEAGEAGWLNDDRHNYSHLLRVAVRQQASKTPILAEVLRLSCQSDMRSLRTRLSSQQILAVQARIRGAKIRIITIYLHPDKVHESLQALIKLTFANGPSLQVTLIEPISNAAKHGINSQRSMASQMAIQRCQHSAQQRVRPVLTASCFPRPSCRTYSSEAAPVCGGLETSCGTVL